MTDESRIIMLEQQLREAQSENQYLRQQTLAHLHDCQMDTLTAVNAMRGEVEQLREITINAQRHDHLLEGKLEHAVATLLEELRSLPCRRQGGNGSPCPHDDRDTDRPPPMVVVRGGT